MERSASKRLFVKIFTPVEVGSVSASELDGLLDELHKSDRLLNYDCTLTAPVSTDRVVYSRTVPAVTKGSGSEVPTIVVDLYVNTGENASEIQQIVTIVHDIVYQKLIVDRNIKTTILIEVINYSPLTQQV